MKTGTVKFFNDIKGYGFVKCDQDQQEYFVHASGCLDNIKDNDKVTFFIGENNKGPICIEVKRA